MFKIYVYVLAVLAVVIGTVWFCPALINAADNLLVLLGAIWIAAAFWILYLLHVKLVKLIKDKINSKSTTEKEVQ